MKRIKFLGSGAFAGPYCGKFGCRIGQVSPMLEDKDADYLMRKMPGCWELVETKTGSLVPGQDPFKAAAPVIEKPVPAAEEFAEQKVEEEEEAKEDGADEVPEQDGHKKPSSKKRGR